ncbi:PP2C family protein-serine/threonine phosphatase [Streptomyces sp. NPDC060232]|uniref:PP2C family protein-serine/threonine phosphatase n=1 Tax=Streptomyces sp. NPDC060232 TaxID=3347079 RepID=UPI00364EF49C
MDARYVPRALGGQPFDLDIALDRIADRARALAETEERLRGLLDAVLAVSGEKELPGVLRRIVSSAMALVDARYGAIGILDDRREGLQDFITLGLTKQEKRRLAGIGKPQGRGLLGHVIRHPEPLRVDDIGAHPESAGFPPGHPPMRTLLGTAIRVQGEVYGDLYLADRRDGRPFDADDQAVVLALAGAAGVAIEKARLLTQIRAGAERFQRLLLPTLPDLAPFTAAAHYRPAEGAKLGGDWYDAVLVPGGACAVVIGDVVGHDLKAAASMAQIRNMLRALLYACHTPPSTVLTQLDRTLEAITDNPVTTVCLALVEPAGRAWEAHWSTAGHLPPALVIPGEEARYLHGEPGLPLGVDTGRPRRDHRCSLPANASLVFYTDGLVEHRYRPLDEGLTALARILTEHADLPPKRLCKTLVGSQLGDGHDDIALLVLRTPPGHDL